MSSTLLTLAIILAITATVVCYIMVIPEKKRAGLNGFLQAVHDVFNFKQLFLEVILKFLYVFLTFACIFIGFFMLFGYDVEGWRSSYHINTFPQGLALMILGPIVVRLVFEVSMMFILLVKNVMQINKKLGSEQVEEPAKPVQESPYKFCGQCGTRYEKTADSCPCCGSKM